MHRLYAPGQFMNPGPAPRPPTERPRLNLSQSAHGAIPTNTFDSLSLGPASPAVGTPSASYFPNTSSLSLVRSKTEGTASVIKEGHIRCKEDKFLAGWNQRYLILREFRLDFLKNENGKVMQSIPLNIVTGVSRSEDTRMAFEVTRMANPKDSANRPIMNRDLPTKTITCEVKNDDEIYDWIDKIYERCPGMGGVSNPTNFSHRIHVGFDPQTGGFVGLPQEWEKLLTASAITKEDYKKNPQAVIEVLEFYSEHNMRAQHPEMYSSTTPTPPAVNQNKQLGFSAGNAVAPPRPAPPTQSQRYDSSQFVNKYQESIPPRSANGTPKPDVQRAQIDKGGYDMEADARRMKELANQEQRRKMEEEAKRVREIQRQRERDKEREREREAEQNRMEQEAYNASIPKTRTPLAKQELGGYGGGPEERYNPSRAAPQAPTSQAGRLQPQGPAKQPAIAAQRPAPSAPTVNTRSTNEEGRTKEVRMSSMSESEVMAKLKQVVSKDNPLDSYSKQKKIGQGASGSVYVARVKDGASSPIARELYRTHGPKGQVAIKQMDLRNQPRKELIVNEIIVMKDSKHPNIVNFLDSFLQEQNNELWVVMEFMEGGALTDVIDNNPVITEDQISTICFETCKGLAHLHSQDIIHRDIKSDNVLLDRIGNVKISKSSNSAEL